MRSNQRNINNLETYSRVRTYSEKDTKEFLALLGLEVTTRTELAKRLTPNLPELKERLRKEKKADTKLKIEQEIKSQKEIINQVLTSHKTHTAALVGTLVRKRTHIKEGNQITSLKSYFEQLDVEGIPKEANLTLYNKIMSYTKGYSKDITKKSPAIRKLINEINKKFKNLGFKLDPDSPDPKELGATLECLLKKNDSILNTFLWREFPKKHDHYLKALEVFLSAEDFLKLNPRSKKNKAEVNRSEINLDEEGLFGNKKLKLENPGLSKPLENRNNVNRCNILLTPPDNNLSGFKPANNHKNLFNNLFVTFKPLSFTLNPHFKKLDSLRLDLNEPIQEPLKEENKNVKLLNDLFQKISQEKEIEKTSETKIQAHLTKCSK